MAPADTDSLNDGDEVSLCAHFYLNFLRSIEFMVSIYEDFDMYINDHSVKSWNIIIVSSMPGLGATNQDKNKQK